MYIHNFAAKCVSRLRVIDSRRMRRMSTYRQDASTGTARRGCLYLVATPIGNLEDITLRALRVLKDADVIACEDTRHTLKLLNHYEIRKRLVSYHEHNEARRAVELAGEMEQGAVVALVSDAGMPVVSDPGQELIRVCIERGIPVAPVPGASAVIAALAASGLPVSEFVFAGFLPARQGERRRILQTLAAETRTMIFYEAPHRIAGMLDDAATLLGERPAVVAREITKVHEEFLCGTLGELATELRERPLRGEMTVLIGPPGAASVHDTTATADQSRAGIVPRILEIQKEQGGANKAAIKQAASEFGITHREAYQRWLRERGEPRES